MKTCNECKYAQWKRTAAGKLHPGGDGRCTYKWTPPPIPNAFYFFSVGTPTPYGGHISRKREFEAKCPYWVKADE